ncbi:MAG TPA: hypothetical protein DCL61_02675, partial [Cyanobacteria bacterium UBA12227]|nr:hypothetical protein [Cyanobacteria bacterium UBA12227]
PKNNIAVLILMRYKFLGFEEWGVGSGEEKATVPHLLKKCYRSRQRLLSLNLKNQFSLLTKPT